MNKTCHKYKILTINKEKIQIYFMNQIIKLWFKNYYSNPMQIFNKIYNWKKLLDIKIDKTCFIFKIEDWKWEKLKWFFIKNITYGYKIWTH